MRSIFSFRTWISVLPFLLFGIYFRFNSLSERVTSIDDSGWVFLALIEKNAIDAGFRVSSVFTYAPLQFILSYPLFSNEKEWSEIIFWMRFLPAIFSCVGLIVLYFLFGKHLGLRGLEKNILLIPFSLIVFNYRGIIESQQGYNYGSVVPAVLILSLVLSRLIDFRFNKFWQKSLFALYATLASIFIWLSYQIIFFVIISTAYVVLFFFYEQVKFITKKKFNFLNIVFILFFSIIILISFYFIYTKFLIHNTSSTRTVPGWTERDIPQILEFSFYKKCILYLIYFINAIIKLFAYSFCFFWPSAGKINFYLQIYGFLLFFISLAPFFIGSKLYARSFGFRNLVRIHLAFLIFSFVLNGLQIIPIGSTRHSYIYQVSLVILILNGLHSIFIYLKQKFKIEKIFYIPVALSFIICIVFIFNYEEFQIKTKNKYDLYKIRLVSKLYKVFTIIEAESTVDARIAYTYKIKPFSDSTSPKVIQFPLPELELKNLKFPVLISSHVSACSHCISQVRQEYPNISIQNIFSIPAEGSSELSGVINGGNGFYLTLLKIKN